MKSFAMKSGFNPFVGFLGARLLGTAVLSLAVLVTGLSATAGQIIFVPQDASTIAGGMALAAPGDTVEIAAGTYYEYELLMPSGVALRGATGDPDDVIIDAQQQGGVVFCDSLAVGVRFEALTFTGGEKLGTGFPTGWGGAVLVDATEVEMINCVVTGNSSERGGGVYARYVAQLIMSGCRIDQNSAALTGGGLYFRDSDVELTDCDIAENEIPGGDAWGDQGAGLHLTAVSGTISGCRFFDNSGAFHGGAVALRRASPDFVECEFTGNEASSQGGVVYEYAGSGELGVATYTECLFADNRATIGGVASIYQDTGGTLNPVFSGCTMFGNWATSAASGISVQAAAIFISNSIIVNGVATSAVACGGGGTVDLTCSNIYNNAGGNYTGCLAGMNGVDGNISADPRFCDAPGGDFSLDSQSPCLPGYNDCGELMGYQGVGCLVDQTLRVPGVFPTILAAMQAASVGDTILVGPGTYYEHDLPMPSGVVLRGETGHYSGATIDAQGLGRAVVCDNLDDPVRIEALTLTNGFKGDGAGGAIFCYNTDISVSTCKFTSNLAVSGAGCDFEGYMEVVIEDCLFTENEATSSGGGLRFTTSIPAVVDGCTFYGNSADFGGSGIFGNSPFIVRNTLISNGTNGSPIWCIPSDLDLSCSDIFGNVGGDFVDGAVDQENLNGNFSADPLYCEPSEGNFSLREGSPCLPENNSCSVQIGAEGMGCNVGGTVLNVPADYATIAAGLAAANFGDTVLLAAGTYYEHDLQMTDGVYLRGGTGDPAQVIIDAQGNDHALVCTNLNLPTRVEAITFTGGVADGTGYLENAGGAVAIVNSGLNFEDFTLANCAFTGNEGELGGAIYAGAAIFTLDGCHFWANIGGSGGALYMDEASVDMTDCHFTGNEASVGAGGALYSNSRVTASGCDFTDNFAPAGAGGALRLVGAGTNTEFSDCTFTRNQTGSWGGAIWATSDNRVDFFTGCTFTDNVTGMGGGAFGINSAGNTTTLEYCIFNGNRSGQGLTRGEALEFRGSGTATVQNCTFIKGYWHLIYVQADWTLDLNHCIAAYNHLPILHNEPNCTLSLVSNNFWNSGGNYVGDWESLEDQNGNISLRPHFCGGTGDSALLSLQSHSPCLPENNAYDGNLIGAVGGGCEEFDVYRVPSDFASIGDALFWTMDGDSVLVAGGTYEETNLSVPAGVNLVGEIGSAKSPATVIDGMNQEPWNILKIEPDYNYFAHIENFVLTRAGHSAMYIDTASPVVTNCVFTQNRLGVTGSGVLLAEGEPSFYGCEFSGNKATGYPASQGGAFGNNGTTAFNDPSFYDCIFFENEATSGSSIAQNSNTNVYNCTFYGDVQTNSVIAGGHINVDNSIFAYSEGVPISGAATLDMACSDLYGNAGGDYVGDTAGLDGVNGNIWEPPLFIDAPGGNFDIHVGSPCGPTSGGACGRIGAGVEDPTVIFPDGTGDYVTIAAAVAAVPDNTYIFLANGTFTGPGNVDVVLGGIGAEGLHILALSSDPDSCVIDLQASAADPHRAFTIAAGTGSVVELAGFTITGGYAPSTGKTPGCGGAVLVEEDALARLESLVINDCVSIDGGGAVFVESDAGVDFDDVVIGNNATTGGGGGVHCEGGSVVEFVGVVIMDNASAGGGGGVHCAPNSSVLFQNATLAQNLAPEGAIYCGDGSLVTINNSIVAFTLDGPAVTCGAPASLVITCSDIFGNAGGDWVGCIADQEETDNNFSADPQFCDLEADNLKLMYGSLCSEEFSPCGVQVGALPVGCAAEFTIGAGGDFPDLVTAIANAPSGATLALLEGVYSGTGFRDLVISDKVFTITGTSRPDSCILDCTDFVDPEQDHQGFIITSTKSRDQGKVEPTVLRDLTIRGAKGVNGGAVMCDGVDLVLENCLFYENEADLGGALYFKDCQPILANVTLANNGAISGGGVYGDNAWPLITQTIIYGSTGGGAVNSTVTGPAPSYTDIFANLGGDWSGVLQDMDLVNENFSTNPGFCVEMEHDYSLGQDSPCNGENNSFHLMVGALPVGCDSSSADEENVELPRVVYLQDCFPNPFNPMTTIRFGLPGERYTRLSIFDVSGRRVAQLVDEVLTAGRHEAVWLGQDDTGRRVASGVYFYRLEAGDFVQTRSMALIK